MEFEYPEKSLIAHFQDIGIAQEKLTRIYYNDLFNNLGKHEDYWESDHSIEEEKLQSIRQKLCAIHDELAEIRLFLRAPRQVYD